MQLRNKAVLVISKVYYLYILRCTMLNYNICKISTGDFRIVPITWFSENNATFQWPPYGNINEVNTAICNMYEPESDWDEISLDKILTSKNDYSNAKDILQIIQVASDQELSELDETKLKKSRSKRHKKKYQSTDDASTSNDENDNGAKTRKKVKKASHDKLPLKPANFQSLLKCTKTTNKSPDATKTRINVEKETVADDSQFSRSSSLTLLANYDNNDNQSSSTVHEKSLLKPVVDLTSISKIEPILSSLVEFSKDIIGKINKLTSSIEDFNKRIQIVENILNTGRDKLINENSITDEIEDFIPLQTVDKFNEFDNKLNDQKYVRQVAKFMKCIGGSETHELVQNILKRFVTNQLATFFNIQGKNLKKKDDTHPKIAFINTNLFKCIMKAAHLHRSNVDENNVQHKSIASWLAQAN